jgi:hypothetical protein
MSLPDSETLTRLAPLRRQLRDIQGMTEMRPGVFGHGGQVLVQFVSEADGVRAELKRTATSNAPVRFAVDAASDARRMIEEVKRLMSRLTDD